MAKAVLPLLMETNVERVIGAGRYECGERTTWRNRYRDRTLDTRLGALQLPIPKLRQATARSREGLWQGVGQTLERYQPQECRNFFNEAGDAI